MNQQLDSNLQNSARSKISYVPGVTNDTIMDGSIGGNWIFKDFRHTHLHAKPTADITNYFNRGRTNFKSIIKTHRGCLEIPTI